MVIWLYSIFSNEAQILPFFMRHYAPQVDRLILFDNGSTDNSRSLIAAYLNAEIHDYPEPGPVMDSLSMAQFASTRYREARGYADWVLWVDCDEFLYTGGTSLRKALRQASAQNIRAIRACGYQMFSDRFPAGDAPLTDQVRCGTRDPLERSHLIHHLKSPIPPRLMYYLF